MTVRRSHQRLITPTITELDILCYKIFASRFCVQYYVIRTLTICLENVGLKVKGTEQFMSSRYVGHDWLIER